MRPLSSTVTCPCCFTPVVSESNSQFELTPPSNKCQSIHHKIKITCLSCNNSSFFACLRCYQTSHHRFYSTLKKNCKCDQLAKDFCADHADEVVNLLRAEVERRENTNAWLAETLHPIGFGLSHISSRDEGQNSIFFLRQKTFITP